jgi:hypothetical protein
MGDQRAIQLRLVRPLLLRVPLLAALGKSAGARGRRSEVRGPAFGRRGDLRRGRQRSEIRNSSAALIVAVFALVLLLPLRVFEIGNPDWRPLGWIHAVVVVTITLLAVWAIGGVPWLPSLCFPDRFHPGRRSLGQPNRGSDRTRLDASRCRRGGGSSEPVRNPGATRR